MRNPKALLWISVLCIALTLFWIILTRLDEASAQYAPSFKNFSYQWIDNVTENVYSINFGDKNTMFVTGGDEGIFYMSTIPVVINELRSERNGVYLWISNILGWDNIKIWKSDNITVIWWEWLFGNNKVVEDYNDNATFFWWSENSILGGMSSDTPTVLLWWMKNKVEPEHDANTIVWWSSNTIYQGAKNVNILWWTRILIDWDDVVAGWQLINGDVSDSFVFNDGDSPVDLAGSGMFFLWVTNGVWFGTWTKERHQWAISNGAVKLWSIDIQGVECTSENVWVMWLWNGCMVWCTSGSAIMSKWEMLGYWSLCEQICKNSDKCIAQELDTLPNEYESFCITWSVDIANTTMCTGSRLDLYYNVVFEAHLIDSDEECSDELINQCVFRCKDQTHLTWDQTWKMGWDTKCFNDCPLPWSGSQYRGHNEIITGYSLTGVNCSDGARHRDTCADYKKQLMCVDGRWYEMENRVVTDTENTDYIYETCTLNEYVCDTSVDAFNLTREDIVNWKEDFIPSIWAYSAVAWNSNSYLMDFLWGNIVPGHLFEYSAISWTADSMPQLEWSTQVGIRWTYKLCIDFAPEMPWNQAPQNERVCQEAGDLPGQYHYKFIGCNTWNGFRMAEDWVCRKQCEYNGQLIEHGSGIALYTWASAICPDTCNKKEFQCYDGILYADLNLGTNWKFISWTALDSNIYNYTWCTLSGAVCDSWYYNIDEATYQSMKDIWIFSSCQNSWVFQNSCATGNRYHLDECKEGYYMSGNTCVPVVNNAEFFDLDVYFLTNEWVKTSTLMDRNLWATAYMGEPWKSTGDWYWDYYQWWNNYWFPNYWDVDMTTEKADVLWYWPGEYLNNSFYVYNGSLSLPEGNWFIEPNYDLWWNVTDTVDARQWPCPDEYHVPTSDEFVNLVYDWWEYGYNIDRNEYCTSFWTPTGFLYGPTWSSDFLMPFGGARRINSNIAWQWQFGYLQTSSIFWGSSSIHSSYLYYSTLEDCVTTVWTYDWGGINSVSYGYPIRCMKNFTNSNLTIHSNGWTWAMIIVHGNKITKLWTPHKWSETFWWWYWDEWYTSKAKTWDIVSAPANLYAKWWNNYTVTFDSNRWTAVPSQTVAWWSMATRPNNPEFPWYDFLGWYLTWSSTQFDFSTPIMSDITLYAKWEYALNFSDLEMYFVTDAWATWYYAMMDRNLWATMTWAWQVAPIWSYGYYYQWWNNYWFPNNGNLDVGEQVEDISNNYWPWNYYNSGTFILEWFGHPSAYISNGNLRWWNGDGIDRQWPCPEWYHIPAHNGFVNMVDVYWKNSVNDTGGIQWSLDSLMPFAGNRSNQTADIGMLGYGNYWSSTHYNISNSYNLMFVPYGVDVIGYVGNRFGLSLRCFKNSSIPSMTINANWWKKALIIVHDGIITKLWTPTKWNMVLKWWYSDPSFAPSSQVHTWEAAPAHLYAKWGCAEGYVQSGNNCVVVYNCGWETPDWNNMSRWNFEAYSQTSWTYKAEWELWACEWRCNEWYIQSGNTCELAPSYECVSDDDIFNTTYNTLVAQVNPATAEGQLKTLYGTLEEAQAHSCSYVCTGDYEFLPASWSKSDRCVRCVEWTDERENGVLVACSEIIDVCPENYTYVSEKHLCVAYWNCLYNNMYGDDVISNYIPENSTITDFNLARSIWENLFWVCKDSLEDVQEHKCQYSCEWNYVCPGSRKSNKLRCLPISCSNNNSADRVYAERVEKPKAFSQNWQYLEATDTWAFLDKTENLNGCFFWCPLDHYCSSKQKCYETVDLKEAGCVQETTYSCRNRYTDTLIWYSAAQRYSIWADRTYQTHAEIWGYEAHSSEWCQEWCKSETTQIIPNTQYWTICWAKCSSEKYFEMSKRGGCKSCAQRQKPNPDESTWVYDNPVNCVDKCEEGRQWWENYWVGWWEGCLISELPAGGCPEWTDYTVLENNQIKCVHNL